MSKLHLHWTWCLAKHAQHILKLFSYCLFFSYTQHYHSYHQHTTFFRRHHFLRLLISCKVMNGGTVLSLAILQMNSQWTVTEFYIDQTLLYVMPSLLRSSCSCPNHCCSMQNILWWITNHELSHNFLPLALLPIAHLFDDSHLHNFQRVMNDILAAFAVVLFIEWKHLD